jgi:hypothetical protein
LCSGWYLILKPGKKVTSVERVNHYLADNNRIEQKITLARKRLTKLEKTIYTGK